MEMSIAKALNPKQEAFVKAYCANDFNATAAARIAGYAEKGIDVQASRLLGHARIKERIHEECRSMLSDLDDLKVQWLNEVRALSFSDIDQVMDLDTKSMLPSSQIPRKARKAIESISRSETMAGTNIKVKMHSKVQALAQLGQFLGLAEGIPVTDPKTVLDAAKRKEMIEFYTARLAKKDDAKPEEPATVPKKRAAKKETP
jgi:phage terminase small subunit